MLAEIAKIPGAILISFVNIFAVVLIGMIVERRHPIEPHQPWSEILLDYKMVSASIIMGDLLAPWVGACGAFVVNTMGGGWIALPASGWRFGITLLAMVLTLELFGYLVHRAKHEIPFLWKMHTLHHSAEAMTVATGARHYWLENVITSACLPVLGILYKMPPAAISILPLFFITEILAHMNVRIDFGKFNFIFAGPQFHRIHHSVEPQHQNKNFCKNLPIFDIIFGTAWMPGRDEFPRTGLVPSEKPRGFWDGIIWPIRHQPLQLRSQRPVA